MSLIVGSGLILGSGLSLGQGLSRGSGLVLDRLTSRYFNRLDGVQECVEVGARIIDDPLSSFDIEVQVLGEISASGTLVSQTFGAEVTSREFQIFVQGGPIRIRLGGNDNQSTTSLSRGAWRFIFDGTNIQILLNGILQETLVASVGTSSEPTATFVIGARHNGALNNYSFFYEGVMANVRITDNGTPTHEWRIDDNSNTITDSIGSNDGTLVNPSGGWGLFNLLPNGNWQGQNLPVPPYSSPDEILEVA